MADIRINSLPTTASASSSDDFIAIDGTTNGTRKLNAYSPTFGGNLTVSGTATAGGLIKSTTSAGLEIAPATTTNAAYQTFNNSGGLSYIGMDSSTGGTFGGLAGNYGFVIYRASGTGFTLSRGGTADLSINSSGNATLAGNLTVSGTGTSSVAGKLIVGSATADYAVSKLQSNGALVVYGGAITNAPDAPGIVIDQQVGGVARIMASGTSTWSVPLCINPYGGNLLVGTATDGGQKLQVNGTGYFASGISLATHTTSAGGIGFGTDVSLYRSEAGKLSLNSTGGSNSVLGFLNSGTEKGAVYATSSELNVQAVQSLLLKTNGGTTALTLDSSQNATFAGKITANGAGSTFKGTATNDNAAAGYVGEFVSSAVVSASAVSLTNATAANITSISLTAGDWDVTGLVQYNFTGATCSFVYHGFSSASASFGAPNSYVQDYRNYTTASVSTHNPSLTFRISLAATTTIYFVTQADFSAGTVAAYGRIQARRIR